MPDKPVEPQAGTTMRRVYDVLAEFPGIECSTGEVASELGFKPHMTGAVLRNLWLAGYVPKAGAGIGRGSNVRWFVESSRGEKS